MDVILPTQKKSSSGIAQLQAGFIHPWAINPEEPITQKTIPALHPLHQVKHSRRSFHHALAEVDDESINHDNI